VRYTLAATLQFPYLKLHQFVYRYSGGLIGSRIVAGRALLLAVLALPHDPAAWRQRRAR
jgi:hypothetical protein